MTEKTGWLDTSGGLIDTTGFATGYGDGIRQATADLIRMGTED